MFPNKPGSKLTCPRCGYSVIKPWPKICPQCLGALDETMRDYGDWEQEKKRDDFRKMEAQAAAVAAEKTTFAAKEFQTSTETAADKVKGVRVVKKKEGTKVDFSQPMIVITPGTEYIKLLGVVEENRIALFCSNPKYEYFLELSCNLAYIATSILGGELDRMSLYSEELRVEEKCFFLKSDEIIYLIYGRFPDKKGIWTLNRMRNEMAVVLKGLDKKIKDLDKLDLNSIEAKFRNSCLGILDNYIKLQEVFSDKPIPSIEKALRVDYFGMSYQSIGVISKIIGGDLAINGVDAEDPNLRKELQESLVTAKLEAIAANTQANTRAMPSWIGVRLGFDKYRFIIIEALPNRYFYQILAEGNLAANTSLRDQLLPLVKECTGEAFKGDLGRFRPVSAALDKFFAQRVFPVS